MFILGYPNSSLMIAGEEVDDGGGKGRGPQPAWRFSSPWELAGMKSARVCCRQGRCGQASARDNTLLLFLFLLLAYNKLIIILLGVWRE